MAPPSFLSVAAVTVTYDCLDEAKQLTKRRALLSKIVDILREQTPRPSLLVLPAGYLRVRTMQAARLWATRIAYLIQDTMVVLFGVDLWGTAKKHVKSRVAKDPDLPFLAYLVGTRMTYPPKSFRQLASSSQQSVDVRRIPTDRIVEIDGVKVGVLVCGELLAGVHGRGAHGRKFRSAVDEADIVADIAHANVPLGSRSNRRTWLRVIENTGRSGKGKHRFVVVAHHLRIDALQKRLSTLSERGEPKQLTSCAKARRARLRVGIGPTGISAAYIDLYDVPIQ